MTTTKPTALAVIAENIPAELREQRKWVCWRYEIRDGKWTKPPYIAGSQEYAKSTDHKTWRTFEEAHAAYLKHREYYDGIGYVLTEDSGYVGGDMDHVRDPAAGLILPWSDQQRACKHWLDAAPDPAQVIEAVGSYAEVSPSGTGLRFIVKDTFGAAIKHGAIEFYKTGRYLTFTGHKLADAPAEIAQTNLGYLTLLFGRKAARPPGSPPPQVKRSGKGKAKAAKKTKATTTDSSDVPTVEMVLEKLAGASNSEKFNKLFAGDWSSYKYPSQSEGDAALCEIIAFWSAGSESLVDAIFRQSQLYRDKWDTKHYSDGRTYGEETVASAVARCSEFYVWPKAGSGKGKNGDGAIVCDLAEIILQTESFAVDAGGRLYRFVGGAYRLKAEQFIKARVKSLLVELDDAESWSSKLANEVLEFIRVDRPALWERPPVDVINLKNGLLRVLDESGQPIPFERLSLSPHDPSWLSTIQLPVAFDPAATCPEIESFVAQVFPSDAAVLAWEIPCYLARPVTDIQKAILLLGPGGNGKSTWLNVVTQFLGKDNVSSLTLHRLEADKFAAARLYGKLANICPDLPTEHLAGTSVFKSITGGDPLVGENKFMPQFEFTPFSRLLFSANDPPRSQDSSQGFFDRWLVLLFDKPIRGTKKEVSRGLLDAKLTSPGELSGMLNMALRVLPAMHRRHTFTKPASSDAAWSEFKATTDPLSVWLERFTVEDSTAATPMATLLAAYNGYLERHGRPSISKKKFAGDLRQYRPNVEDAQRTVNGKPKVWCYVGIGLTPLHQTAECDAPKSRESRDSRDNPLLVSRGESETTGTWGGGEGEEREQQKQEQDRADRVNRVNAVTNGHPSNGHCEHDWIDERQPDGRIRRGCSKCGNLYGYVPQPAA